MSQESEFIIDLVWNSGIRNLKNIALIDADAFLKNGEHQITYEQLFERVQIVSDTLKKKNVITVNSTTPLVSIMCNRGIGSIICILSVLKAGAAYVPVDPSFPPDRQVHIFTHSKSEIILTDEENAAAVINMFNNTENSGSIPPMLIINSKTGFLVSLESQSVHSISRTNSVNSNSAIFGKQKISGSPINMRRIESFTNGSPDMNKLENSPSDSSPFLKKTRNESFEDNLSSFDNSPLIEVIK